QDLDYALRQLRRSPGFAAAAILTLALGAGANLAVSQALHAALFRDLPVREPARLVEIQLLEDGAPVRVSYPLFRELALRQQSLEGVFAVSDFPLREAVLRGRGDLRGVRGALVSGGYFRLLGVPARTGRMLSDDDDRAGAAPVAVLSDAFWAREFGRSPVLGQVLRINNAAATVVGVAPPGFFGETPGSAPDLWLPLSLQPQVMPADWLNAPSSSWLSVLGRLRAGTSRQQAQAAMEPLYRELTALTPTRAGKTYTVRLLAANRGIGDLATRFARPLWLLQGIALLTLLIACGNLAGLLAARAGARAAELGVRIALGAGRRRLVRQLLTESLVLGILGAAAAVPAAMWGTRALIALASGGAWQLPVAFGWNLLAAAAGIALLATCLFGLAPALMATRIDVRSALEAGRSPMTGARARLGRALIAAQVAISLTMLSGASLLAQSLWNLRHQDFGFDAEHVVAADLPVEFVPAMLRRATALRGPLFDAANALPGVRSAAVSSFGMLGSITYSTWAAAPGHPMAKGDFIRLVCVSARYFETLGIPILEGRGIAAEDRGTSPKVVVLSQTAARTMFGGENPVGRHISMDREYNAAKAILVIGVAHDVRYASARDPFGIVLYVPLEQNPAPVTAILIRPAGDPRAAERSLRAAIARVDPDLRVGQIRPLADTLESGLASERTLAVLSGGFGLLALTLTCVGVYGVIAYAVRRRTREIGVRIALGAGRGDVTAMLLAGVLRLLATGLVPGAVGAYFAVRALRGTLFGIAAWDLTMPAASAAVLAGAALAAAWLPARRAALLDPMDALRRE
ncbi:MAG: ABC transporter permease, partial [Acidobacteria bacterium]|nr:ABC transporter permease [Acidobacteriota bacterium]